MLLQLVGFLASCIPLLVSLLRATPEVVLACQRRLLPCLDFFSLSAEQVQLGTDPHQVGVVITQFFGRGPLLAELLQTQNLGVKRRHRAAVAVLLERKAVLEGLQATFPLLCLLVLVVYVSLGKL